MRGSSGINCLPRDWDCAKILPGFVRTYFPNPRRIIGSARTSSSSHAINVA